MSYKSKHTVSFADDFCETLSIDAIISDEDWAKLPGDYKDSWKKEVAKPTHEIKFAEGCVYQCIEIDKKDRYDDIKNWFKKKI